MKIRTILCAIACWLCATAQADIIKGTVKGDGKALGEVIVTDGFSFSVHRFKWELCYRFK